MFETPDLNRAEFGQDCIVTTRFNTSAFEDKNSLQSILYTNIYIYISILFRNIELRDQVCSFELKVNFNPKASFLNYDSALLNMHLLKIQGFFSNTQQNIAIDKLNIQYKSQEG